MDTIKTDCLVIGAGLAGCAYAHYASRLGSSVTLVCSDELSKGANSQWAQGGIIYDTSVNAEQDQLYGEVGRLTRWQANPVAQTGIGTVTTDQ